MVFGIICEELGLIIAVILIFTVLLMAVYAVKYASNARSSFYTIASVSTAALLVFQMMLNVLGCVDILLFTGVTFPFVSRGGSSLIACFGLLAFLKACDTRQDASFTVRTPKKVKIKDKSTKTVTYNEHTEYDFEEESEVVNSKRVDEFFSDFDDRWLKDD